MRCANCGFDNGEGCSVCVKCRQPLQAFEQHSYKPISQGDVLGGTVIGQPFGRQNHEPRPTVITGSNAQLKQERETVVFPVGGVQKTQLVSPKACPNCEYPIVANHVNCPRCGISLAGQKVMSEKVAEKINNEPIINGTFKCQHCQNDIPLTSVFCPFCGQRAHAPTVLPKDLYVKPSAPICCLTMVSEDGELLDKSMKEYSGESVVLNRFNTEENNPTITTQKQAELKYEDGEWYLLNLSEHQTTYLELNRKIQLEEGDVVVLGNRRFKFEKKQ